MRIAYIGATPLGYGGLPYVATQILRGIAGRHCEVDCYVTPDEELPAVLRTSGIRFVERAPGRLAWRTSNPLVQFLTWQGARLLAQRRLVECLLEAHRAHPYDVLYQCSQIELPGISRQRAEVPPVVMHPGVHAAGLLRRHRAEAAIARRCEPLWLRAGARAMLVARSAVQSRSIRAANVVVAPSRWFAERLSEDYGIPHGQLRVVPNPIDLERFRPAETAHARRRRAMRALFVSRLAVGKGVESVVELSNRLADLRGELEILVVGSDSMWSDYRPLLRGLHPGVARYLGAVSTPELTNLYRDSDLLLQPSHYDTFALTVGEGLASGLPVVASDAVGATEGVDRRCCAVFRAGDEDAFETSVRTMLDACRSCGTELSELARAEAERLFAPPLVADAFVRIFRALVPLPVAK
jgi:glycosyltransferase involved in cell wall biosynthesis